MRHEALDEEPPKLQTQVNIYPYTGRQENTQGMNRTKTKHRSNIHCDKCDISKFILNLTTKEITLHCISTISWHHVAFDGVTLLSGCILSQTGMEAVTGSQAATLG